MLLCLFVCLFVCLFLSFLSSLKFRHLSTHSPDKSVFVVVSLVINYSFFEIQAVGSFTRQSVFGIVVNKLLSLSLSLSLSFFEIQASVYSFTRQISLCCCCFVVNTFLSLSLSFFLCFFLFFFEIQASVYSFTRQICVFVLIIIFLIFI